LTAGEEDDSWESWHDGSAEGPNSVPGDLLGTGTLGAGSSWGDHVWLQEQTLDEEVLGEELLHNSGEDLL